MALYQFMARICRRAQEPRYLQTSSPLFLTRIKSLWCRCFRGDWLGPNEAEGLQGCAGSGACWDSSLLRLRGDLSQGHAAFKSPQPAVTWQTPAAPYKTPHITLCLKHNLHTDSPLILIHEFMVDFNWFIIDCLFQFTQWELYPSVWYKINHFNCDNFCVALSLLSHSK